MAMELCFLLPKVRSVRFGRNPKKNRPHSFAFPCIWLELMEQAVEETDATQIAQNREALHKYLTRRAEKDPGYPLLKRLVGESLAREVVRNFLFEGVDSLGDKSFLDYFPENRCHDGTINPKHSMIGKAYAVRPWDANGEFIGNDPT